MTTGIFHSSGGDFLDERYELTECGTGHVMGLTVLLGGLAVRTLTGGHEEDGSDEGLLVVEGVIGTGERGCELADECRLGLLILTERGAEQHEGLEMGLAVGGVELQVMEDAVGFEALSVLLPRLTGLAPTDAPLQDVEQFALHPFEEIGTEELVGLPPGDVDVGVGTLIEVEGELVVEDGDAQGQLEAVSRLYGLDDLGTVVLEESPPDVYRPLLERVLTVGTEGETLAALGEQGDEGCHLLLVEPDGVSIAGAAVVEVETSAAVPVTIEQPVNLVPRRADEHKIVEDAAQGVVVVSLVGGTAGRGRRPR